MNSEMNFNFNRLMIPTEISMKITNYNILCSFPSLSHRLFDAHIRDMCESKLMEVYLVNSESNNKSVCALNSTLILAQKIIHGETEI